MENVYTVEKLLAENNLISTNITVRGWVKHRRDSKAGFSFLSIHDGSCFYPIQAVIANALPNYQTEVLNLTKDCSVAISGTLVPSTGRGQSVEIRADKVYIYSWIDHPETYPISPKRHTMEHLREFAHLRVRTNLISAVARMRHTLSYAIHTFLNNAGFFWVNTPILTANDCEGAGELFHVSTLDQLNIPKNNKGQVDHTQDFFNRETFLTVSGQLNVESYCMALSKVYTFGPTFRAENSNTSRHLAEFWMVEPEIAFADLNDNANLAEQMLKAVIQQILEIRADDMGFFNQFVEKGIIDKLAAIINNTFVRIEYTQAIEILIHADKKFEFPVVWGADLQSEHERFLCETYFKAPVIVMNYPKGIKAFYMRLNSDNKTVAAMDVLLPGIGEIIGGSQREERLDIIDQRILETGVDAKGLYWYRDLRRYGTVPHSGFGLGFERLLGYITGVANIRDVIPFPRTPGNASF